jgi:hypothetical protein
LLIDSGFHDNSFALAWNAHPRSIRTVHWVLLLTYHFCFMRREQTNLQQIV